MAVFVKKEMELIEGTARNSRGGHHTIGAYKWRGYYIIIGGIYGLSVNSDRQSAEIFEEYLEWHRELTHTVSAKKSAR